MHCEVGYPATIFRHIECPDICGGVRKVDILRLLFAGMASYGWMECLMISMVYIHTALSVDVYVVEIGLMDMD